MNKLIEALEKKRGDTSVVEFAEELGIHFSTYYRLLEGKRGIGPGVLEKILGRYPDLALVFLPDNSPSADVISAIG